MAVVRDGRIKARQLGDVDALYREEQRRTAWRRENALRRHNFVGFIAEVLKSVVRSKVKDGPDAYSRWLDDAQSKTKARAEERLKQRGDDAAG